MALSRNLRRFAMTVICVTLIGGQVTFAQEEVVTPGEINGVGAVSTPVAPNVVTTGVVNCDVLNVRLGIGTEQPTLGKLWNGNPIVITDSKDGWFYVTDGTVTGWICGDYVGNLQTVSAEVFQKQQAAAQEAQLANQVVAYSRQFVGKPYVAGGSGPNAFDCSGFVRYVYGAYGVSVPHSSKSIANIGQAVALADIEPGDIMCFAPGGGGISHVGIYAGDGKLIHASTGRRGVTYDGIRDAYYAKSLVKIVRVA